MEDTEKQNIIEEYTRILDKYSGFIKMNHNKLDNIANQKSKDLVAIRKSLLEYYNEFSDLEINTSKCKCLDNDKIMLEINDTKMSLSELNEVVQILLNRISIKYIYPITLQLSGLDNKKAKRRDFIFFAGSIFISSIISMFTTWYFDKENDNDLENYSKTIINQKKDDSIMIRQNNCILRENRIILDSLILRKK